VQYYTVENTPTSKLRDRQDILWRDISLHAISEDKCLGQF